MRPPVAAEKGNTPLRGKKVQKIFELANGEYEDKSGYRITMDQVVQNYTDDARLQDSVWDQRHHITPSGFNNKNSKYYKVSPSPRRAEAGVKRRTTVPCNSFLYLTLVHLAAILRKGLQEQGPHHEPAAETA